MQQYPLDYSIRWKKIIQWREKSSGKKEKKSRTRP
jgi:hypothetical protein